MSTLSLFGWDDPTPDLADYDVILVNTSAGKDSLVMVHEIHRMLGGDPRRSAEAAAPAPAARPSRSKT